MPYSVEIDSKQLRKALNRFEDAMETQASVAMSLLVDLAAAEAKTKAPEGETGLLKNSVQGVTSGRFFAGRLEGVVSAGAPYAEYVEEGTRPHIIRPKHRKTLRFPIEGGFRFARKVQHPGTRAQPFMGPALQEAERDADLVFGQAVDAAARIAGFR